MSKEVNVQRDNNRNARNLAKVSAVAAFNETYALVVESFEGTDEAVNFEAVTQAVAAYQLAYKTARADKGVAGQVSQDVAA